MKVCYPTLQQKRCHLNRPNPWIYQEKEKNPPTQSSVNQQCLLTASWIFSCWQLHVQQVGLGVDGKQTGLEACKINFLPMQGFEAFWGMYSLFELQVNSQRCCCADYLFWAPHIPLDVFFNAKHSGGVNMWVGECAQSPEQFGDGMSGRSWWTLLPAPCHIASLLSCTLAYWVSFPSKDWSSEPAGTNSTGSMFLVML